MKIKSKEKYLLVAYVVLVALLVYAYYLSVQVGTDIDKLLEKTEHYERNNFTTIFYR